MSLLINAARFSPLTRFGSLSGSSRSQSMLQFSRRMSTETSGASQSASTGMPVGGLTVSPWDANNRIRVVGATLGVIGASGMLFDTFYRRATKQELNQAMEKFDAKIDREMGKLDAKIDGLTNALLHTNQRDRIAAETENHGLRS